MSFKDKSYLNNHLFNEYSRLDDLNQHVQKEDDGKIECAICLDNINYNYDKSVLNCGHGFHKNCIDEWINKSVLNTCPCCRSYIDNPTSILIKVFLICIFSNYSNENNYSNQNNHVEEPNVIETHIDEIINNNKEFEDETIKYILVDSMYQVTYNNLNYSINLIDIKLIMEQCFEFNVPHIIKTFIDNDSDIVLCITNLFE
jgi:hypothetical protein